MSSELQPLSAIFNQRIFRIPDYQRGYAWTQPQLVDFWEDVINLQPDRYHYTGLLSLKPLKPEETAGWGEDTWLLEAGRGYKAFHVVDGQQRMTTFVILVNEILNFVKNLEENQGLDERDIYLGDEDLQAIQEKYICKTRKPQNLIKTYLFSYEIDNPSADYMRYKIFEEPHAKTVSETYYTKNLKFAKSFFAENISKLYRESGQDIEALDVFFMKITNRLMFNIHEIADDYDVFAAFETMNNRGKKLSNLELLKNRLIYLTTLYDDRMLDERNKAALRNNINETWKEIYYQLGRNKSVPLSDDEFLRAHWIIYYTYTRKSGTDYNTFLLHKFSAKGIFEKESVVMEQEEETLPFSADLDDDDDASSSDSDLEVREVSKLRPEEIDNFVGSLKELAKYWYATFFPQESDLTKEEKKWIEKLNRLGMNYFRPLITVIISKPEISPEERVECLQRIERFIFCDFRMARSNSTYGSSEYNRFAHQLYLDEITIDDIISNLDWRLNGDRNYYVGNFIDRINKLFDQGWGYYGWNSLRYFLFEYEASLAEKNNIDRMGDWGMFTKSEKDKVSIEHILPQTPTDPYWVSQFEDYDEDEIRTLTGALGNLLPLSQSINSSLQNDSFDKKKHSAKGRRGYENGSHSEIEVSKIDDWDAIEIYNRSFDLLDFMQDRWGFELDEDEKEELIGLPFVED